jgi:hypothetical protein
MSDDNPSSIGPQGRWIIFGGTGAAVLSSFDYLIDPLDRAVDNHIISVTAFAYILVGVAGIILVATMILYNYCPKKLVIPLGVVGWIAAIILQNYYFWFGPGALKLH